MVTLPVEESSALLGLSPCCSALHPPRAARSVFCVLNYNNSAVIPQNTNEVRQEWLVTMECRGRKIKYFRGLLFIHFQYKRILKLP